MMIIPAYYDQYLTIRVEGSLIKTKKRSLGDEAIDRRRTIENAEFPTCRYGGCEYKGIIYIYMVCVGSDWLRVRSKVNITV